MIKSEYVQDIWSRVKEYLIKHYGLLKILLIAILPILGANILGYLIIQLIWGQADANQFAFRFFIGTLFLEVLIFSGILVYLRHYEIPETIYNEQKKAIKTYYQNNLPLQIGENIGFVEIEVNGKKRNCLTLEVKNINPHNKIVELVAKAEGILSHELDDGKLIDGFAGSQDLLWLKENANLTELDTNNSTILIIAFLEESNLHIGDVNFESNESLFQLILTISGKHEGGDVVRHYREIKALYSYPTKNFLAFPMFAKNFYKDIHPQITDLIETIIEKGIYFSP